MENQKKKMRLDELTVESFVTSSKASAAKGGTGWTLLTLTPTPFLPGCGDTLGGADCLTGPTDHPTTNEVPWDTIIGPVEVYATLEPENTNCNCPSYHSGCYRP